jgi:hypothetical protein
VQRTRRSMKYVLDQAQMKGARVRHALTSM